MYWLADQGINTNRLQSRWRKSMTPPKRVIITNCPHNGRHQDMKGYVVDTYPDGTASVDIGHNHCCITADYVEVEQVRREDLVFNDDGLTDAPDVQEPKKRRGRPPKSTVVGMTKPLATLQPRPEPPQVSPAVATKQNILVVSRIDGSRVSLLYQRDSTRIELDSVSAEDLERISAILGSLTKEGHD
jgi:hypothetical protein